MEDAVLEIILRARDEATQTIKSLRTSLDNVKPGADIVTGAMVAVGAGVAAASVASVKLASDFQSSMTLIQTQAGASADEVKTMSAAVLNLAGETASAPKTLADGLFQIESAGFRGAKALDILKLAAEGAKVGNADLGQTANVLTTLMVSNIKGVTDANSAMGVLNATVGAGKMHMQDLVGAMGTGVIPVAQSLGISMQSLGASIATMTNNGVGAEEAATRLKTSFAMMEDPTSKASNALQSIGISHRQLADDMRGPGGLSAALEDIKSHLNAVEPATTSMVKGTKETGAQLLALQDHIKNTQAQLKILSEEHVKAGVATDKHNLAITKAQAALAEYQAKLGGANKSVTTLAGGTMDATQKTQLLLDAFGGGRQGATMLTLIGQTDQFNDRLKQVTATGNNFQEAWKKTSEDANTAFERLGAQVQVVAINFGNQLLPAVTNLANFLATNLEPAIQNATNWIDKNKTILIDVASLITAVVLPALIAYEVQMGIKTVTSIASFIIQEWKAIAAITMKIIQVGIAIVQAILYNSVLIAGAIAQGVMTVATGALTIAMFLLTSPIGLVILAIIALIAVGVLLMTHWQQVQVVGKLVFAAIGDFFTAMGKTIKNVIADIILDVKNMVNSIIDGINTLIKGVNTVTDKIPGVGTHIQIPSIAHFDQGGYVPSTGLAVVHEGEFVLSKDMLSGKQSIPQTINNTTNSNQPINIYATVNQDIDMNLLGQKIAFAVRNSR